MADRASYLYLGPESARNRGPARVSVATSEERLLRSRPTGQHNDVGGVSSKGSATLRTKYAGECAAPLRVCIR
jgi:hypothetical protein